jgi:hypothetical protein
MVPKRKPTAFLQLFLPGVVEQEQVIRNRAVRALSCRTKGNARQRQFLIEVNEQPCEIRPIASEGSTELRYLHSTQNLYDYMLTYGNDTVLYVKLLRGKRIKIKVLLLFSFLGDPPIKAIEFDGYMVLKNTLNGDKIPICRVEDLEVTLVSPDFPVKVRLPTKGEYLWRSLPEIRAAEIQCMQLSLALLARHESEMYVTIGAEKNSANFLQSDSNQEQRSNDNPEQRSNYSQERRLNDNPEQRSNYSQERRLSIKKEPRLSIKQEQRTNNNQEPRTYYSQEQRVYKSQPDFDAKKKHIEECEKVFGTDTKSKSEVGDDMYTYQSSERLSKNLKLSGQNLPRQNSSSYYESSLGTKQESIRISKRSTHIPSDKVYQSANTRPIYEARIEQEDSTYNRSQRPVGKQTSVPYSSGIYKTKTNTD